MQTITDATNSRTGKFTETIDFSATGDAAIDASRITSGTLNNDRLNNIPGSKLVTNSVTLDRLDNTGTGGYVLTSAGVGNNPIWNPTNFQMATLPISGAVSYGRVIILSGGAQIYRHAPNTVNLGTDMLNKYVTAVIFFHSNMSETTSNLSGTSQWGATANTDGFCKWAYYYQEKCLHIVFKITKQTWASGDGANNNFWYITAPGSFSGLTDQKEARILSWAVSS